LLPTKQYPGTIVNLQLRTDDQKSYKLKREIESMSRNFSLNDFAQIHDRPVFVDANVLIYLPI